MSLWKGRRVAEKVKTGCLGLTQEELRHSHMRDKTLEDLEKADNFHRKNRLLYQRWIPGWKIGDAVK